MIRSTERILTTHTGSLPRPEYLIELMFAKEEGNPVDKENLKARIALAVSEIVQKQIQKQIKKRSKVLAKKLFKKKEKLLSLSERRKAQRSLTH